MAKFKNQFRIESTRKCGYDYSANGFYFITMVCQNRICHLGNIINNSMVYSDFGYIVKEEWIKTFQIRKELELDEWVIMPNHMHAIIVINKSLDQINIPESENTNKLIRLPKSISSLIAGFKSAVNSKIDDFIDANDLKIPKFNRENHFFQPNYHDRIIRTKEEYISKIEYIKNNPQNWNNDKFFR